MEKNSNKCAICHKTEHLKQCSSCKSIYYCGTECQLKDWPSHKPTCKKLQEAHLKREKQLRKIARKAVKCGLCGKTDHLTKTPCCDHWICDVVDDELEGKKQSLCYRNHDRYTICAAHYEAGHKGTWKNCQECRDNFLRSDYIEFSTNDYNFEKLQVPDEWKIAICSICNGDIQLGKELYRMHSSSQEGDKMVYICQRCDAYHT